MANDAVVFLIDTGQEPGHVYEGHNRDVERITGADEAGRLLGSLNVEHAGVGRGLVPDHAYRATTEADEAADNVGGPLGEVLEELVVVGDRFDHLAHVIRDIRAVGDEVDQLGAEAIGRVSRVQVWRRFKVVRRQERQEEPNVVQAGPVVRRGEGGNAGLGSVRLGAAQFLLSDIFSGHRLHHIGAGDEHVGRVFNHEDEVRHGRAVHGTAGARSHNHADLGHNTGRLHVSIKDAAIRSEADGAFLNASAGAVVEANNGSANFERHIHELVSFLGEHLSQRPTKQREVLGEDEDLAPLDGAPTGDHTIGVRPLFDIGIAVPGQHVELTERAVVQQVLNALTGQHLAAVVLALHRTL